MDLTPFEPFLERLSGTRLAPWVPPLRAAVARRLGPSVHGDLVRWEAALAALPDLPAGALSLDRPCVGLESGHGLDADRRASLETALMALHPWRKGPFRLHDVVIESEWRSDFKWDRLAHAVAPLDGRLILDVGCGNGYHAWRMLGAGAELVLGIDPTLLYALQFQAINRYLRRDALSVLPLALEDLPGGLTGFDTLFSMGVLYHRRSPLDHLLDLRRRLRPGGTLVLETLVIEGTSREPLAPPGRYAGMRTVWLIPSVECLVVWLRRCDFTEVEVVDVTRTGIEEQRATDWMRFQSLSDHLSPQDPSLTIEGHPAPRRAILIAKRASDQP